MTLGLFQDRYKRLYILKMWQTFVKQGYGESFYDQEAKQEQQSCLMCSLIPVQNTLNILSLSDTRSFRIDSLQDLPSS